MAKQNSVMVQIKPKGSNQIDASIPNSIFKMFFPNIRILFLKFLYLKKSMVKTLGTESLL
jgi:hypothetical protein